MKWFLEEAVEPHKVRISHGDKSLFMGSCFSENVYQKGRSFGMNFYNSKFGTIFHPIVIARILQDTLLDNSVEHILERDNRFYSWDGYSKFNANSKEELQKKVENERQVLKKHLSSCKFLFLTFGTAKGYINRDGLLVANCHKLPSKDFTTELSVLSPLKKIYIDLFDQIKTINPTIEIVLTVSPVRHAKDGLVSNNRSKARLLQLCEELEKIDIVSYFPAYEMVVDELRDYRFYTSDLVHPNDSAINYVWQKFQNTFFSEETVRLGKEVEKRRAFFNHVPIAELNESELELRRNKKEELTSFLEAHPEVVWE